ncbi:MAG: HYR domain-containing protein [Flavobacteriales bacterium]|nr:HYR domain-containing protein [Flavobacteriales bacterium]
MKRIFTLVALVFFLGFSKSVVAQCSWIAGSSPAPNAVVYQYGEVVPNAGCGVFSDITNYSPGRNFLMRVLAGGSYSISTCNSPGFDSQLTSYQGVSNNGSGNHFAYNDDNGPICSGLSASLTITPTFTDYTRVQVSQFSCLAAGSASITVSVRQNNNLNITSSAADMCVGQTRNLTATPASVSGTLVANYGNRGTFSGTGTSGTNGSVFTAPTPAGASQVYTITYTFGFCTTTQNITVYRNPTVANAGADQVICGTSTSISGNTPTYGTGQWTLVGGSATIAQPSNATTNINITSGNSATFRWTITNGPCAGSSDEVTVFRDNVPPTITCPSNQTTTVTSGTCSRSIIGLDASVSDLCGTNPYTFNMTGSNTGSGTGSVSGNSFNAGLTTVTYSVTDLQGNPASCQFTVTVNDNILPTITCPSNISVNSTTGVCGAAVSYAALAFNDNCPGATVATFSGLPSGATFPLGTSNVTLRVSDVAGNGQNCSFSVTVTDVQNPTISCPTTVNVNTTANLCTATATWTAPVGTDNCPNPVTVRTTGPAPGSSFPLGSTTIGYTVTDASSNAVSCSFSVVVTDNQNPVITCPSNISVPAASGTCVSNVSYSTPTATDNCGVASVTLQSGGASGSSFTGTSTVTWRATDNANRTADCSFTVTVTDSQVPTITCPADITTTAASGVCTANVSYQIPTAFDNCPGVTATRTAGLASGSAFPIGQTMVTYTATDASTNTTSCSFNVTVTDNQNPVIAGCPAPNLSFNNDPGQCSYVFNYTEPTVTDNCPGATITRTAGLAPGSAFPAETNTTVTYTATDAANNTAVCTFIVRVEDVQNPSITCPANITVNNSQGLCGTAAGIVSFPNASFSDNCAGTTLQQTAGNASGATFSVGTQTVTFVATDAASNTNTCSFTVTVNDNEAPIYLVCPTNFTVNTGNGICNAVVTYPTVLANDNCGGSVAPVMTTQGTASGSVFPLGQTTVTYTATDASSNVGTCSFVVTVRDQEGPQINCPSTQTVTFDGNCQYQLLNYLGQVSFLQDNCDIPTLVQSPAAATTITGSTQITITATDLSNNSSSCNFFVNPNDVVDPVVTCPSNQEVPVNSICQFTLPNYVNAVATDDCDPNPTVTQSPISGAILTSTTVVTLTVVDDAGNSSTCTFDAGPLDATNPVISCPSNQLEVFNTNCQLSLPNYTGLGTTSDNCGGTPTVTQSPAIGAIITSQTVVTLTATDGSSNQGVCTFSVIPSDNIQPTITCPVTQNVAFNSNCQFTVGNYVSLGTPSDNCDVNPSVTQSPVPGTSISGPTTASLTVTDASGNTGTCNFQIVPTDQTAPNITCPADQLVNLNGSCERVLLNYMPQATATDNCDGAPVKSQSPAAGTTITANTTVTINVVDNVGNTNSCSFLVEVQDVTPPTISCGGNINVNFNPNCQFVVGNYVSTITTADNCGGNPVITQSPASGTTITGLTTITMTATDASGNAANCTFNINPIDNQNPIVTCPANINVSFGASCNFTLADYTGLATATDNCDVSVAKTQSPGFGTVITTSATVTITGTDDAGNTGTCSFAVIPVDNTIPTITCPGNQSAAFSTSCNFVLPSYVGLASASDNCDNSVLITQSPAVGTTITGSQQVTLTGVDNNSNSVSCVFSIIPIDNTPPVITCPANQPASFNAQCQFAIINYTGLASASDNCGGTPVITQSPVSGTSIATTSPVTLTATDASGNTATCSFNVIPADITMPSISCPGDQNVNFNVSCQYNLLSYTGLANVNDNCDPASVVTQSPASGTPISATTVITLTATDASSNVNTCSFSVIPADNTNPSITCPGNQSASFDAGCQFVLPSYTSLASTTDNCDLTPTISQSPIVGTVISGAQVVTLTSSDDNGNIATCTFSVNPIDNVVPIISCPGNQVISSNVNCDVVIPDYTSSSTASDNCDLSLAFSQLPGSGTIITVATTVTITVTDDSGNDADCSFLVTPADNNNPNITCPGNQIVNVDATCQFLMVDYTGLATATDNCSASPTVSQDINVGTPVVGTTTVTLTATDTDLNTASCTFDVVPEDATAPVVSCPVAQTAAYGAQCQLVTPDYTSLGSVSDNCDSGLSISQSPVAGSVIGGNTTITLSSIDGAGNVGTCTFSVTVSDQTMPFLACPSNQVEAADANCQFTLLNYVSFATVSDNCDAPPFTVTQSPVAGTTINGNTTVQLSVTDIAGNNATCTFDVLPDDVVAPVITCPAGQTASVGANCSFSLQDYTVATNATDNCDQAPILVQTPVAGTTLTANTLVTLTATDIAGNAASCSFNVTPVDATIPSVACPGNQTVNANPTCGFSVADVTGLATISDNCDNTPFITQSPAIGTLVTGTTTMTVTAVDDAGNSNFCTFTITPIDITVPTIQCPSNLNVSLAATCDFVLTDYRSLATAIDNCDNSLTLIQSPASGTTVGGSTAITLTALDDAGNSATCTFSVIPADNTAPTITCPANASVNTNANCQFVLPSYVGQTSSSDNCTTTPVVTQSPISGSSIGGVTTVTMSATDAAGNVGTCSFVLTPVDNQVPVFANCPVSFQLNNTPQSCGAIVNYAALSVSDNCAGVLTPIQTAGGASGSVFPVGVTAVSFTATDNNNNSATCSFSVTVVDSEIPTIVCPSNISANVNPNTCGAVVTYALPTTSDNCSIGIMPSLQVGLASGATFPRGTTVVTYQATDVAGNSASCSFNVTVVDNQAPVITCPANITTNVSSNSCQAFVSYALPTISDNCATGLSPVLASGIASGASFPLGTTNLVYQANDGFGNSSSCSFTVTVNDNIAPIMFGCPIDITVNVAPGTCGRVVQFAHPTATDNCIGSITPSVIAGFPSGSTFPMGLTTVTFQAVDGASNVASCSFDVTVIDNEDPVITCPANISVSVSAGTCGATVTYSAPTATDNCTTLVGPTLSAGQASGTIFPEGVNTVSYIVADGSGNTDNCSFIVTVIDNEEPTLTCPADFTVSNDPGQCGAVATYNLPTVVDNCSTGMVPYVVIGSASGSMFTFGPNTITYEAADASGNTNTCTFTISVEDNEAPVLTCPNDTLISCDATVAYALPVATDNCNPSPVPVQTSPAIGFTFPAGPTSVIFTADDGNGNTGTCTFVVTVIDSTAPAISCPVNQYELFNAQCQLVLPDYTSFGTGSDNCDAAPTVTQSPAITSTVTGTTTVTLSATDLSGNTSTCSFDVIDATPPVVSCPPNQTVNSDINCQFMLEDYTLISTVLDNCGGATLSQSPAVGTMISNQETIRITAEDDFGNISTCTFEVILEDNIAPSLTCIGNQVGLFDANCQYQLPDYTSQAFSADNCDLTPTITQSPVPGTLVSGASVITLTSTDDDGNSISCAFNVSPNDNVAPVIMCPSSQPVAFNANCGFSMPDFTSLGVVTDNCSNSPIVTQVPAVGSNHTTSTIVTLTANDGNGNTQSCLFLVVPVDQMAPSIVCPADVTTALNANCEFILTDYTALATTDDNCSNSIVVTQNPTIGSVLTTSLVVTLTANDGNGNTSVCTFNVQPEDVTAPVVACASDQQVQFNQTNCSFQLVDYTNLITANDNCANTITYSQSPVAGTTIAGLTTLTLTAEDESGNTASCSLQIIPDDVTLPTITCPADQQVNLSVNCGFTILDYTTMATVNDNCTIASVTQSIAAGTVISNTVAITLTATDDSGNIGTCAFNVIPFDVTAPSVLCPQDIQVSFDVNCGYSLSDYQGLVQVADNCANTLISQQPAEGTLISGPTEVVFTVVDDGGNSATCSFDVIPSDNQAPTIVCPDDQEVALGPNCQYPLADYSAQSIIDDNCSVSLSTSQFPPVGSVILSTTTVTISIEDDNGNQAQCSFVVQPTDQTAPIITTCAPGQTIIASSNCGIVIPDVRSLVSANDNCDATLQITQYPAGGTSFVGIGSGVAIIVVTDDAGNSTECEFNLTAIDNTNPIVTCPPAQTLGLNANCEFVVPNYTTMSSASDACGAVSLTQSPAAGSVITSQLNATIIAEDENGNTATCTFFVTPIGMQVSVQGANATCSNGNNGSAIVTVTGGTPPYSQDWAGFNPTALAAGNYAVIVTDVNGCSATGSVTIGGGQPFQIELTPNGVVEVCEGESVQLSVPSGYAAYNWSTGATVSTINVSNEATYWVSVTDGNGCVSNTDTTEVVFYTEVAPVVEVGSNGLLTASNDTAQSYQWYLNGSPIPGATSYVHCPTVSGNYVVVIVDANGCEVESNINELTFNPNAPCLVGIEEYGLSLNIYPNPSNGQFSVKYELRHDAKMELAVFDMLGNRIIETIRLNRSNGVQIVDLTSQADGVYLLRVLLDDTEMIQQRLILVK